MTTALDLITNSVQKIGVYAPGETLSAADSSLGLTMLNAMLDTWSNESLMSYCVTEQHGTLVPGQYQYKIGANAPDFNMTRPLRILDSPGTCYVVDPQNNRYNLEVVTQDRWNLIWNIVEVTSDYPNTLFYDPQYPLGIINVYPVPIIGWQLYWDSRIQFTEFASLSAVLSLPPGYQAAIQDNLAVELWPYFKPDAAAIPQSLIQIAARSKGIVKRTNVKPNYLNYDPEVVSRAQGSYNIYSDSSRAGGVY